MMMRKTQLSGSNANPLWRRVLVGTIVGVVGLATLTVLFPLLISWYLGPHLPRPRSDVPITADIVWLDYQDCLNVSELNVEVVKAPLNLMNHKALVRFRLRGTLSCPKGLESRQSRPFIKKAHVSERFLPITADDNVVDVQIMPVVGLKADKNYHGEPVPFDIKVEKYVHTYQWGENSYVIHAGSQYRDLKLHQSK